MAHELLSIKLCELDRKIGQLHSRIQVSQSLDTDRLDSEIQALRQECSENDLSLQNRLKYSKAKKMAAVSAAYDEIEEIVETTCQTVFGTTLNRYPDGLSSDEQLLFAEYVLDFALQSSERALLVSLEAIRAQRNQSETEGTQ